MFGSKVWLCTNTEHNIGMTLRIFEDLESAMISLNVALMKRGLNFTVKEYVDKEYIEMCEVEIE